jgi:hypothetical protein
VQSDDEEVLPEDDHNENFVWDTTAFDHDDEDAVPQSSPIKKFSRIARSPLGKRQRAASPMVVVALKRTRMTPPDTPVEYYPELPEQAEQEEQESQEDGVRRSRRSRTEIKALASRLRTQRSRTSLESGLRTQQRKTYVEPVILGVESSEDTNFESEIEDDAVASSGVAANSQTSQENTHHPRGRPRRAPPQYDGTNDDADERDDLGITPARPEIKRRTSTRVVQKTKQWWKVDDSDDEGSADELSFH